MNKIVNKLVGDKANITPKVLKWARESARLSPEAASAKAGVKVEKLLSWEDGTDQPTIKKAELLSVGSIDNAEAFSIYPNPVMGGEFTLRLSNASAGRYIACIITSAGQQIKHKMIEHINGDLIRQVDMSGLPAGIYKVVLRSATKKFTETMLYVN